ncbi:hypothetical protein [Sphingobacterium deserti]|uniref:Uncharacterized protein n=1 Tax=Sphingobacterium deserti TaxID=1229276 RepID=A0A0B8T484_9SPHI|nr:hypothetical protein [Sphingobacterium deserti]KGE14233.1 hypothetical protein DI53_2063 [Sphingobacterium deserti]
MKMKLSICFISVFLVMQTCVMARSNGTADSVLNNIQERVYNAFVSDVSQKTEKLQELKGQLGNLDKGKQSAILVYWRAYLQFYTTILYSQSGKKSNAKEEVDFGIELLSSLPNKSSEDFALLARLESNLV